MPFCPDCGTQVSEDTRFCPECGKLLIKAQSEQSIISETQEEADDVELETDGAEMKRDIRSWGFGLVVIGVIHIVFSGFLDPVWGGILIAIGIACLFIRRRGMYIAIGIALMLAGIMNILLTVFGGWTIFGVFQIGFGIHQIHKFRKYRGIQPVRTQDAEPTTSASYRERSAGEHRTRNKLLIGLGAVVVIVLIVIIAGIPSQQAEPEPPIPAHFTTYTDGLGLFSISYPPEWELALEYMDETEQAAKDIISSIDSDLPVEKLSLLFMAGVHSQIGLFPSVNIVVEPCPLTIFTHDSMVKWETEGIEEFISDYYEFSRVKTTIDGRTATIFVCQGTFPDALTCRNMQTLLLVGRTVWVVTCTALPEEYSKWEDDFDAIVRSLRILK